MVRHWRRADLDADGLDESRGKREKTRMVSGFPQASWRGTGQVLTWSKAQGIVMSLVLAVETLDRKLVREAVWAGAIHWSLAVWRWYLKPRN